MLRLSSTIWRRTVLVMRTVEASSSSSTKTTPLLAGMHKSVQCLHSAGLIPTIYAPFV